MAGLPVELEKLSKGLKVQLDKKVADANNFPKDINVTLALDVSGSMHSDFRDGAVLHAMKRIVAVSNVIDDDGILNFYCFSDVSLPQSDIEAKADFEKLPSILKTLEGKNGPYWSGTQFKPVLQEIIDDHSSTSFITKSIQKILPLTAIDKVFNFFRGLFGIPLRSNVVTETVQVPGTLSTPTKQLVLLITDGANFDEQETLRLFDSVSKNSQFYFQCIGVGYSSTFLKNCAKKYPNVGYTDISSFKEDDDSLANALVSTEVLRHFGY